jgi:hypothetical protein
MKVLTRTAPLRPAFCAVLVFAAALLALLAAWSWETAEGRERRLLSVPLGLGVAAAIAGAWLFALWPAIRLFHGEAVHAPLPVVIAAASAGLLAIGLVAAGFERRGIRAAAVVTLTLGVVATLVGLELGGRVPFDNRLYPIREAAKQLEAHIPPEAAVGYLDAHRVISLAVYLSRPLKHLPAPKRGKAPTPPPMPDYVVLLAADFQNLARPWSLERVDEVVIRDTSYVLAHRRAPESS